MITWNGGINKIFLHTQKKFNLLEQEMIVKASGVIEDLGITQQVTDKMKKRDIVIRVGVGQYPDYLKCEAINDKIAQTEKLRVGDEIEFSIAVNGRKVIKKDGSGTVYFTSLKLLTCDNAAPIPENSLRYDAPF